MKKTTLLFIAFGLPCLISAQTYQLKGVILDDKGMPVKNATIDVEGSGKKIITNDRGEFDVQGTEKSVFQVKVQSPQKEGVSTVAESAADTTAPHAEQEAQPQADNIPVVQVSDDDLRESSNASVASVLGASRDVFANTAAFNFSAARFRIRGYNDENFVTLMNGIPMTDLTTGRNLYSAWSGLNDVMRNRESTIGLSPSYYAYGEVGGSYFIDSRASRQRKQLQASYALSNRTYDNRFMITYGSGILKGGWSYALSYSKRWADEGFVEGTFYDGNSYFASVEKQVNNRHSLALTMMGALTKNGRSAPAVQEMFDLTGTNYYNPNWGYQEGKKRNAVVANSHQPLFILTHDWKIDERSSMVTALGCSSGKNKLSGLDWFNAIDPRPDYYRKLPSFDPAYGNDPVAFDALQDEIRNKFRNDVNTRQINWTALYEANQLNDTVFNNTSGRWAKYIIQNRVTDNKRFSFNSYYNRAINDHFKFTFGVSHQRQATEYYKEVDDLLGADFYVDLNQYAEQDNPDNAGAIQNDLNNPDRILKEGDKFGYDYTAHINKTTVWSQSVFNFNRFDYMLAVNVSNTNMYRDGHVQNGIFSGNSYGKSSVISYPEAGVKGGAVYKYNGRNYFFANAGFQLRAPYFDNLFLSPNTRNTTVSADDEAIVSLEGGYLLKAPRIKGKLVGYLTQFNDQTDTRRFYHGDYRTFVNYTLTNIDIRHIGTEAAVDINLGKGFSTTAVVAYGQYFYTSRPNATITQDNKDTLLAKDETIYFKNIRLSGGPQQAYALGLNYRSPRFWYVYSNINFFDGMYYDANPARRTMSSLELVDAGSSTWNSILDQKEVLPAYYTIDLSAGWSYKLNNKFKALKRNTFILFNLGISNITNNTDIITSAFEQLRFDEQSKNINTFAPKFSYGFGRTYFASIILRMN